MFSKISGLMDAQSAAIGRATNAFKDKKKGFQKSLKTRGAAITPAAETPAAEADLGQSRIEARRQGLADEGALLGNSMDGKSFDEVNAEIQRRDWDNFDKNDKPYILNYADEITSGKYLDRSIEQARQGVEQGFNQAESAQNMRDKDLGVGLSSAQIEDRRTDLARGKTAALIDAENNARLAGTDRDNALLAGSHMPTGGK